MGSWVGGTDIPAPQAAGRGGGSREAEPTQETRCGWEGSRTPSTREHGSARLPRHWACPCHQKRALGHASVPSQEALRTEHAHSGQRWRAPGQSALDLGGGAPPCSSLRRQERGPHARTARAPAPTGSSPGTWCQQGVWTGLGTRGYRVTPRGGLRGVCRTPWGSCDAVPHPWVEAQAGLFPPCAPKDLQLHPAGAAQSANTRARVRAWELPRHGRAPRHPARRCARRPGPPGQVGPRLPPDTPVPPHQDAPVHAPGTHLSPWIGLLHRPWPPPPPQLQGPWPSWRLTWVGSGLSSPRVREECHPRPWGQHGSSAQRGPAGPDGPSGWSGRPPEGALPSIAV